MAYDEKYIGESKLTSKPTKPFKFQLKDGCVTTEKVADKAITEEKLSEDLQEKIHSLFPTIALGFYTDETEPVPMLMLCVRPAHVDETVVPFLLSNQEDVSYKVTDWTWKRETIYTESDIVWNNSEKAHRRKLHITNEDFPGGKCEGKISFKCQATFVYEGLEYSIINVIPII